jgi:hypothetical protein
MKEYMFRRNEMKKYLVHAMAFIAVAVLAWMTFAQTPKVASRAYVGHQNDRDMQNFIRRYPKAVGTRLDDCQTCHRAGVEGTDTAREYSPCGYCHLKQYPNARNKTADPNNFHATLNAYGLVYKQKGRTSEALAAIAQLDSDGDGSTNVDEIAKLRYPGNAASRPGQPLAPAVTLTWNKIRKLLIQKQFMLMNTTSEPNDDYVSYSGVRIKDLLEAAGANLAGATGITVFAPDGYSIDYSIDDINTPFPKGYYYTGPGAIKEKERAFVRYPESIPSGVEDSREIPDTPSLLLAFYREGKFLDNVYYEKGTGRIAGEGPYRLIKPQRNLMGDPDKPGRPDRSVKDKTYGDGWDFNKAIDHNAGACVRGASVIRINPMPQGLEEYDWKNSWPLVTGRQLVIFGYGIKKQ